MSPKQRRLSIAFRLLAINYLLEHPTCELCLTEQKAGNPEFQRRPNPSEHVHHKKGRGKYLLVVEYFMAVCFPCHALIDRERSWAYQKGYLLKRLTKTNL